MLLRPQAVEEADDGEEVDCDEQALPDVPPETLGERQRDGEHGEDDHHRGDYRDDERRLLKE